MSPFPHDSLINSQLPSTLRKLLYESHLSVIEKEIQSRATITCALDARELVYDGWLAWDWFTDFKERVAATSLTLVSLRHTFTVSFLQIAHTLHFINIPEKKQIGQQTRLRVATKLARSVQARNNSLSSKSRDVYVLLRGNILGTITHQLSSSQQIQVGALLRKISTSRNSSDLHI